MLKFAGLALFISGIAAFTYQLSWIRLLGINISSTAISTALILTAIFGGLAAGSLFAQWRLRRGQNGLNGFIIAQIIVAISALLLLPVLGASEQFISLLPNQHADSLYGLGAVLLILLIPTMAMGTSFPFFTAWFAETQQNNKVITHLYALMTLGAITGVLLASFYLIPQFGLEATVYSAAAFNLLAILFALSLRSITPVVSVNHKQESTEHKPVTHSSVHLITLAGLAFALVGSEVVWTKYLTIYSSATSETLATIITLVLLGLATGATLLQYWQTRSQIGFKHQFALLIVLFITLNLTHIILGQMPFLYDNANYLGELFNSNSLLVALLILPSTILVGMLVPLSLTKYTAETHGVRSHFGFAYAIYGLAAMIAAAATTLWILPEIGSGLTLVLFAAIPLATALFLVPKLNPSKRNLPAYALILSLATVPFITPLLQFKDILSQHAYRYGHNHTPDRTYYLQEGRTGLISLIDYGTELVQLQQNGLNLGMVHYRLPYKGLISESLSGALPFLLQPDPANALVLGFQAGTTTRILANSEIDIVKVIESEPKLIQAMRMLGERHFDFFEDGRVEIEYNDPRIALLAEQEKYSIITSRPLNPWLAGSTHLYSQEFFELVKSRLTNDGIFSHTFSLFRMDTQLFKSVLQTFYHVFPQGAVFGDLSSGELILLGGNKSLVMDYERTRDYLEIEEVTNTLRYGGFRNLEELPGYFLFSSKQARVAAQDAEIITDDNLLIENRISPLSEPLPTEDKDPYKLLKRIIQQEG